MGRKNTSYEDYCAQIHTVVEDLVEAALHPKLQQWVESYPEIKQYIEDRHSTIAKAQALVNTIDPALKVTGPITRSSTLYVTSQWIRDKRAASPHRQWSHVWYASYRRVERLTKVDIEHDPILEIEGGIFRVVADKFHLAHMCEANTLTIGEDEYIVLGESLASAMRWASNQLRLIYNEFNEWTNQFTEYPARRARDLAFYFSPVFGSFSTSGAAKPFRQRPRIDDYIPMTNDLATLLTMARASQHYNPEDYRWRAA